MLPKKIISRKKAEQAVKDGMNQAAASLETVVYQLTSAATELAAQIEEVSHGTSSQRDRITETVTAMEEMNSTILEVARNANEAAHLATTNKDQASSGKDVMVYTIESVTDVQRVNNLVDDAMKDLHKKAEEISNVITTIEDIADQTNLLALNAAIEAARAGDAGRGFAVVADEVRKLADRSLNSTKEIQGSIKAIQDAVNLNLKHKDESNVAIERTVEASNQTNQILGNVLDSAEQVTSASASIATATEEQSAASEEINRALSDINQISIITATNMEQATAAVNDINVQIHQLTDVINSLKS